MSRTLLLALSFSLSLGRVATAQDSPRHALASCMMKRMAADRGVSYNEAQRACRDEAKGADAKPQTPASAQNKAVS